MPDIWDNAHKAIDLLQQHNLMPEGDNFAVFYSYISKNNSQLVAEFDEFLSSNVSITSMFCEILFEKYIQQINSEKIINAGDYLAVEMMQVIREITEVGKNTHIFNTTLNNARNNLDPSKSLSEIKVVVDGLSSATENMANNSLALEHKLNNTSKEIDILRQELEVVKNEAYRDALTNLSNRKALNNFLDDNMARANKENISLCGIIIDIDDFKRINDTWGHLTGDQVIKFVASVMEIEAPDSSIVCRYGGEEFIMVLPNLTIEDTKKISERIRKTVENKKLIRRNSRKDLGRITISLGIAKYINGETANEFIDRCDSALYVSKNNGKNRTTTAVAPNAFQAA